MPVDFFAFLTARAAVSLVTAMLTIAIGWHLYQNSGDPFDLALVGLMQIIPIFLFFFVTGWATDSLPRKALLIICTITEAVILIGITMAMLADDLNLTVIFALLFAHGGVKAFTHQPSKLLFPTSFHLPCCRVRSHLTLPLARSLPLQGRCWQVF